MFDEIFDIEKFKTYSDENYYYFFRALEELDLAGIANKSILDENGNITKLITDREFYNISDRYSANSNISLEEIFNHIKMHYSKDTNCISFSSNANVALTYGRKEYKDQYITIKVPKNEMGKTVYNAGLYMIQEMTKKVNDLIENEKLDELQKYYIKAIDETKTQEALDRIKETFPKEYVGTDLLEKGISFPFDSTKTIQYQALNAKQNLEKNKLVLKIDVVNKNIIPNISNNFLIQTLGNAFASLEVIHYKDVDGKKIIKTPKEIMDVLGLLQQIDNYEYLDEMKQIVISKLDQDIDVPNFKYEDYETIEKDFTIEDIYNITGGLIDYKSAVDLYKKAFYLAKSKLRTQNTVNLLNYMLDNNPKYHKTLRKLLNDTYGIEPEIITKLSGDKINVSESVSLDFKRSEIELFNYVNNMTSDELNYLMDNPNESIKNILSKCSNILSNSTFQSKEDYFANTIIDTFDWKKIGIEINFSFNQRMDIINALKEHNFLSTYNSLKEQGINKKDIAKVLLTNVIKNKDTIDLNDKFTISELEEFIGYNKIKGSRLVLRDYQAMAYKNINKIFQDKNFATAVLPTGAGKSFVALAEMSEYKDKNILYLAPSEEILNQIKKYIWENYAEPHIDKTEDDIIQKVFPNLTLSTYAYLTSENSSDIIKSQYDLIVFDELHRTGAKEWNNKINDMLTNQHEKVKVLGITATPQRDADLKDMSEHWAKYFGYSKEEVQRHKHLAINMDLIEAIKLGYVVNPKIVNCEYTLLQDGSMEALLEKINASGDEEAKKKYEILRRNLDKSKGIEQILSENIKPGGKYIVFCPVTGQKGQLVEDIDGFELSDNITVNEILEQYIKYMREKLTMFAENNNLDFDQNIELSSMLGSYSSNDNKTNLNNFAASDNKTKFMIVMNKLNEGVHVGNIDGIIWLRPMDENSKILYLQQLGRCIYGINPNEEFPDELRPTVIDLVNNTLKVKLDKNDLKTDDLDLMLIIKEWINENNKFPNINSSDKIEKIYAKRLKEIQKKYFEYIDNNILEQFDESYKVEIKEIIKIGNEIDLWNYVFPKKDFSHQSEKEYEDDEISLFEMSGILRDFVELDCLFDKLTFEEKFETYYGYLIKLQEQGDDTNLSNKSKLRISEDGKIDVVKPITKRIDGKKICINKEEYNSSDLVPAGSWFYENQSKFTGPQKQKLRNIGYVLRGEEEKFEIYYGYLAKLNEQGDDTNLSQKSKLRIGEDGKIDVVKPIIKMIDGKPTFINKEEYNSSDLVPAGNWFYENQSKFTGPQKQKLRNIGYVLRGEEENKFEIYYGYLAKLKEQGDDTNLSNKSKLRIGEDGKIDVVKPIIKMIDGKQICINKEEYNSSDLVPVGRWFYVNQDKFTDSQKQKLRDIGYILREDVNKKYHQAEKQFNLSGKFKEVEKLVNETEMTNERKLS